jgi:hypothetical protein
LLRKVSLHPKSEKSAKLGGKISKNQTFYTDFEYFIAKLKNFFAWGEIFKKY